MQKIVSILVVLVLGVTIGFCVWQKPSKSFFTHTQVSPRGPVFAFTLPSLTKVISEPVQVAEVDTIGISAQSFLVFDEESGKTLIERHSSDQVPIASLTKLTTGVLAYNWLRMEDGVVTDGLPSLPHPITGVRQGDVLTVKDHFEAMLVGSANDSAEILGKAVSEVSGASVVSLMNEYAQAHGMLQTVYKDVTGLDSGSRSTAQDLKTLLRSIDSLSAFELNGRTTRLVLESAQGKKYLIKTSNKLISQDPEIENIKTGYTEYAGGAMISRAQREGKRVIIIVLRSANREQDTILLKNFTFDAFQW